MTQRIEQDLASRASIKRIIGGEWNRKGKEARHSQITGETARHSRLDLISDSLDQDSAQPASSALKACVQEKSNYPISHDWDGL